MTEEEYTAFLRARKPEVYIQNSSGVPAKWIVTRAYINGVTAKRHIDAENYSHDDTGFFPVAMLMTKEQVQRMSLLPLRFHSWRYSISAWFG